jgi:Lon protease-like protein
VPLLPLFPLDVVLFPGTPLPLHIFEPRYREMIGECIANNSPFGMIRAQPQGLAEIGCTAQIVSVTKKYPDGRLDIVTEGRNRFEVLQLNQERSFLRGEILLISDEPGKPTSEETARAIQLHADILALAGATQDLSAADHSVLSFYLAGSLPLDLDFKQKLLEMRSEKLRIAALIEYLDAILPKIRRATRARTASGGNGHVH